MNATTAVILAGGRATRMGRDKALVEFQGKPMLDHVVDALVVAALDILIVGRSQPVTGTSAIADVPDLGGGPGIGLLTAFRHIEANDVLLVAVDQPMLRPTTISEIIAQPGSAVVPHAGGHPQVTCALYRRDFHEVLEQRIAAGEMKLRRVLDHVAVNYIDKSTWSAWGEDGRSWMSLDTPQAVLEAEDLL